MEESIKKCMISVFDLEVTILPFKTIKIDKENIKYKFYH